VAAPPAVKTLREYVGKLRVLVVHDWLVSWAGSERCLKQILAIFPQADLVVGFVAPRVRDLNEATRRARETWLGRIPGVRTHHRWFVPLEAAAFASLDTRGYDLVISSSHAFAKAVRGRAGAVHVCYCHSPPRYLWDLYDTYRRQARGLQRLALAAGVHPLRWLDRRSADGVDRFVCNSHYVARRIERYYRREADVVYPPVEVKPFNGESGKRDNFLLYLGRLVPYKRVDLAILAAERLGIKLVVAGDGPSRPDLERLAGRWTEFVGEVSEEEAGRLLSTCAAFVFCAEEDFGIAPVEANAHGAPVVALRAGGILETMREMETAVLFDEPVPEAIARAIVNALEHSWDEHVLRANALRFSPDRFREGLVAIVTEALRGEPRWARSEADLSIGV
jgi:glycosyltransferase involved in cell wall biosynthesis